MAEAAVQDSCAAAFSFAQVISHKAALRLVSSRAAA